MIEEGEWGIGNWESGNNYFDPIPNSLFPTPLLHPQSAIRNHFTSLRALPRLS